MGTINDRSVEIQDYLLSLTKVLLNVLHHCQSLLLQLLKDDSKNDVIVTSSKNINVSVREIQWPSPLPTPSLPPPLPSPLSLSLPSPSLPLSSGVQYGTTSTSQQWLNDQLMCIKEMTTNILIKGKFTETTCTCILYSSYKRLLQINAWSRINTS